MQWLASICVRRPVFATVLILVIVVVGIVGYSKLERRPLPQRRLADRPVITALPGAAPEEIETELTDKIEEAVNTISGIDELRSISTEGVSQVIVTLPRSTRTSTSPRRRCATTCRRVLPDLPEGTKTPVVSKLDPDAAPVLFVALRVDAPDPRGHRARRPRGPAGAGEHLRRRPGRRSSAGASGRSRCCSIPTSCAAPASPPVDVQRAIVAQNVTTPGGAIDTGPQRLTFRVQRPRAERSPAVGDIIIRSVDRPPDPGPRRRHASSTARRRPRPPALLDGKPAVVLSIRKQSGENSVAVVDALRERMKELEPTLPGRLQAQVIRDNTETHAHQRRRGAEHLILGALLAALVVLLFLGNLRSTIIAALAIPTSIIGTFMACG